MSTKIEPGEVINTEDISGMVIRTRCSPEYITDDMVKRFVQYQNLSAGDVVRVQCMDHERTTLLAEAEWRVTKRAQEMKVVEKADFSVHHTDMPVFEIVLWDDWRILRKQEPEAPEMSVKWNPGHQHYEIRLEDQVIAVHPDKQTAHDIAAGKVPLPEMA